MPKKDTRAQSKPTRPERRVSRAQKTRDVDAAILASALDLLASSGVDGLALTKVAAHAGMSNGPLYGRYDSAEDIALQLWEEQLRDHFVQLIEEFSDFAATKGAPLSPRLHGELTAPGPLTNGAVEIIAVARRFPLLTDVVRSDLEKLFHTLIAKRPEAPPSLCALTLTVPTGCILHSRSIPASRPPFDSILEQFRDFTHAKGIQKQPKIEVEPVSFEMPSPDTGDIGLDKFVSAVMEVVSRVGFENATAHRISRSAGHSFSSAYTHVSSKDELMHLAITQMMNQIWQTGPGSFLHLDQTEYRRAMVSLQLGLLADSNRAVRQLRTETTIAMRHHPDLAASARKRTELAIERIIAILGKDNPATNDATAYWHLTAASGIGSTTLGLLTQMFQGIDWTPIAIAGHELALKSTLKPLRDLAKS
jgi:AcrR family transcriptional regulator